MKPLIITATPNICRLQPDVPYPRSVEDIVAEARRCEQAGARIFHIHAEGRWAEVIEALRQETTLVIQCGMSSLPIPDRMDVWTHQANMVSMIVSHHDEAFAALDVHVLHPRQELEEYMRLCNSYRVKPELEIWHAGSIWNMRYLIEKGLLPARNRRGRLFPGKRRRIIHNGQRPARRWRLGRKVANLESRLTYVEHSPLATCLYRTRGRTDRARCL